MTARAGIVSNMMPDPTDEASAARERADQRARLWRLAIGGTGLFWVGVLLLLMG